MDKKTNQSNPPTPDKPPMPLISSFSTGGSSSQQHTHQPMSPISFYPTVEESAKEHDLGDEYLTEGYLTEKEQQLLLDEEALRETLVEQARDEKEWEERIKQEQAHDELFKLEIGVKSNSEYENVFNVRLVKLCTLRTIVVLKGFSGIRSFVILIKHPTCLNDPLRIVLSVETQSMVIIVKDVLFYERNLRKICLPIVLKMEFSKILPSHNNTNVANALREPFVVNQDPGKNSSQSHPQINHHCCYGYGDSLKGIFCHQCACELCGNGAHYGYNCPPKVPIVPDPEPFNNQTIKELPPTVPSFDPTCYSEDGNSFTYDSKSNLVHDSPNVFDPLLQLPFYSCEFCGNDARYGHYCTPQVSFIYPEPCYNQDFNFPQDFHDFQQQDICCESCGEEEKQIEEDQAANALYWKIPACYDDDDDDYTFGITPNEPDNSLSMGDEHRDTISATESDEFIKSSVENLVPNPSESKGEYECDVSAREVFTTFSNILFDADYDFYSSDDQLFSDEDILKKIYSNPLFDEEIISMKIDPHHFDAESDLIESLLNHDSSIISSSSKIDSLFDEFTGEFTLLKSIPPGIDETDCDPEEETHFIKRLLYDNSSPRPPEEYISENSDAAFESFSSSPILVEDSDSLMEEIDLSFTPDDPMPPGIEEDDYDSERDILIFEELLANGSLSFPENESFHFDIPSSSRPPAKPPDGNTGILNVKVMGDISEQKVTRDGLGRERVSNDARNYEILYERDDDDAERPDKRQKSGDRHQPTTQQSSHRNHGHNNDRHGSDRRSGSDNHRSNNNYSGSNNRNFGYGRDQRNRGQ
nr:hypothetical protein [Tanacetum cinerariifolium]